MKPLTNPSNCKKQPKQAEFLSNNRLQNSTWVPDWHTDWQAGSVGDAARHCSSLSLSLSLSLPSGFFRVPQDKENEKTMKSTSNEEVGFECAHFRFRVSGKGVVLAGVGRVLDFDDTRRIRFLNVPESEIRRFSMTSKNREQHQT